ncbi:hypothetical protein V9T40_005220 [Parthenolecanium corni]|uniref:Uncharacterized protein n=1 Tax=Parthenolecanium corni TaxID=536013 RepID=A0AAN9TDQ8_9HEMI
MKVEGTGNNIGVWICKELLHQIGLAKTAVSGASEFFHRIFRSGLCIIPKLDLVSVPQQGNTSTQNYGMITLS